MEQFSKIVGMADNFVWGWVLIALILAVGVWLTVRTRFVQVRHLGKALKFMVKNEDGGTGEVSSFGALCTALSATIGTGNIVGVATAICLGGPGALLWMEIAAFFGMATKYAEGLLAVKFREEKGDGHFLGGPFYYIEKGMGKNWKWLGKVFAFLGMLAGLLGIGTITQVNGITTAIENFFDPARSSIAFSIGSNSYTWATVIGSLVVTIGAAMVIIGGIRRIANVSMIVVPFMAIMYVVFAIIILICNAAQIPNAIVLIVKSAFLPATMPAAVMGGAVGATLKVVMQKGIGRGIFSNEAGLGSAPIAAAAAQTNEPVRQGLVTMTGTFIDTIVICTMTGLSVVTSSAYLAFQPGIFEGAQITSRAWETSLPWNPEVSKCLLMICLAFFAYTTILGWDYYSERCLEYFSNGNRAFLKVFRYLYILAVLIGPFLTVSVVWSIADVFNGLMAFPNLIALFALSGVVAKETKDYFDRQKKLK